MSLTEELVQLAKLYTSDLLSKGEYEKAKAVAIASWSIKREHPPEDVAPVLAPQVDEALALGKEPEQALKGIADAAEHLDPRKSAAERGVRLPGLAGKEMSENSLGITNEIEMDTELLDLTRDEVMDMLTKANKAQELVQKAKGRAPRDPDMKIMSLGPRQFDALRELALAGGCVNLRDQSLNKPDPRSKVFSGSYMSFNSKDFRKLKSAGLVMRQEATGSWRITDDGWMMSGVPRLS